MPRPDQTVRGPEPDGATKVCPFCAEVIKAAAIKCRFCQSDLSSTLAAPGVVPTAAAAPTPVTEPTAAWAPAPSPTQDPDPLEAQDHDGLRRDGSIPLRRVLLLAVLAAALPILIFSVLGFLDWREAREIKASEDAARTVRASVTDKVEALLSYDHATFDEDLDEAKKGMTSSFEEEYEPTVAEIRDRATAQQRSQEAEVVAVAVVSKSPEEVEALVFVNTISSREGTQRQRLMQNRVSVTMVNQDDTWLIDELSVPQS